MKDLPTLSNDPAVRVVQRIDRMIAIIQEMKDAIHVDDHENRLKKLEHPAL